MNIDWPWLLMGVLLLLPPPPFSATFQKSLLSVRRSRLVKAGATVRVWQNWVDLIRAIAGVSLLFYGAIEPKAAVPGADLKVLAVQSSILGAVVLVQTVRLLRSVQVFAPVFYLCGITLVMGGIPWHKELGGIFAVMVGWAFAIAGKNLVYQLPAMAVAFGAAGYLMGASRPLLVLTCLLIATPLVLATFSKKPLIFAAVTKLRSAQTRRSASLSHSEK